jgi:hypothetical protein
MGIISRSCDVYFGQARLRKLSRNILDNNGGWLSEIKITMAEFKSVYDETIEGI